MSLSKVKAMAQQAPVREWLWTHGLPWLAAVVFVAGAGSTWAQAPDVELYEQAQFAGVRLTLSNDVPNLSAYGVGGRVMSVVVRRGQWEFCTQPQFSGACITVGPGRFAELPGALRGTLMSMRLTGQQGAVRPYPPVPPAPPIAPPAPPIAPPMTPPAPPPPPPFYPGRHPTDGDAVVLWERADFTGNRMGLSQANPRLSNQAFNDTATAVDIYRGRWQLCQHADYAGECVVLAPGRYVLSGRLVYGLSSLRPVFGQDNRAVPAAGGVLLFEHSDFQGRELFVGQATPTLAGLSFNDRTSSIEVLGGRWEFCTDADYQGRCSVLGPGRHQLDRSWNDRISSVRPR